MNVKFNLWPNAKPKALTLSYDDGQKTDLRLSQLLRGHGIKATLHLVSSLFDSDTHLSSESVRELSKYHEISVHTHTHPFLPDMPNGEAVREIYENKRILEDLCCYPMRGMSYPYGRASAQNTAAAELCGMEYARLTGEDRSFCVPQDFLRWVPTCHHRAIGESFNEFSETKDEERRLLFTLWGHSHEFRTFNNWHIIEDFCKIAAGHDDIWYAFNIEVCEYSKAVKSLIMSANGRIIQNRSCIDVWLTANGKAVRLPAGGTLFEDNNEISIR